MDVGLHAGTETDPEKEPSGVVVGDRQVADEALPELYALASKPSLLLRLLGNSPKTFLMELDTLCVVVALLGTYGLLKVSGYEPQPAGVLQVVAVVAAATAIHLAIFVRQRLYLSRFVSRSTDEIRRIFHGALLGSLGFAAFAFAAKVNLTRTWVLLALVSVTLLVSAERMLVREGFRLLRRRGDLLRPIVVVGSNSEGRALCEMFDEDPTLGYRVIGLVDDELPGSGGGPGSESDRMPSVLGPVERTLDIVRHWDVNGVVIAATALDLASTNRLVRELTDAGVHVELSSSLRDIASNRLVIRPLGRFPVAYVEPVPRDGWRPVAKRWFDVAMASFALIVSAPVLAVAAIAIKLDSPGPVLFRQERIGRDGRRFHVFKLRTMVVDAEARLAEVAHLNEADGPLFKVRRDPRITRVGRFLRKTSVDELPQLMNVLRDEMSMVGPRPALEREVASWDPELRARLRVRPGITGMWQVSGRSDSSFEDYQRLDLYYVDNWSLVTDMTIVLRTIPAVLFGRGAS